MPAHNANLRAEGFTPAAERHLEDPGNYSFAEHVPGLVTRLVREVAAEGCDAVAIHCTNFRGLEAARLVRFVQEEGPPGRLLFDARGDGQKSLDASHVPTHVVFDGKGREVARSGALDAGITAAVERLLAAARDGAEGGAR